MDPDTVFTTEDKVEIKFGADGSLERLFDPVSQVTVFKLYFTSFSFNAYGSGWLDWWVIQFQIQYMYLLKVVHF